MIPALRCMGSGCSGREPRPWRLERGAGAEVTLGEQRGDPGSRWLRAAWGTCPERSRVLLAECDRHTPPVYRHQRHACMITCRLGNISRLIRSWISAGLIHDTCKAVVRQPRKQNGVHTMTEPGEQKQYVPVFVGSTYEDLKEYRDAARDALHRLETIVRGMEYFGSKPGTPKDECLKAVQSCKVYMGIFAMRYGSIDEESGKSMTHLEYDEAQTSGLPTLLYLIDEQNQSVLPKVVDIGDKAKLLQELKDELKRKYVVSFFTTPEDLAKRITQDLPPILEQIGVKIESEPEEVIHADAKEILARFRARPAKYTGREITLRCRVTGEVRRVDEEDCDAFKLPIGDAIKRRVESDVLGKYAMIIATREIADWLEELPEGSEVTVRVKMLSEKIIEVQFPEDGPISKYRLVSGYQVTEVLRPGSEPNAHMA